jgi:poly(3-hydroxyalkanoate) synthetase
LLIKNRITIQEEANHIGGDDNNQSHNSYSRIVSLKNINMPFLNIVAKKDDLVEPSSSKALNDVLTETHDKSLIEFNSGHVGLMIGKKAHKELWPTVGEWIKNHQ